MRALIFFIFLFLNLSLAISQVNTYYNVNDSLNRRLINTNNPTEKAEIYLKLIIQYQPIQSESFDTLINEALIFAKKHNQTDYLLQFQLLKIKQQISDGKYKESVKTLNQIAPKVKKHDNAKTAGLYNYNLCLVYSYLSDYNQSIHYGLISLDSYSQIDDSIGIAHSYLRIGICYEYIGELNTALDYYFLSDKFASNVQPDFYFLANLYNNIGIIYHKQENYELALENYNKAKKSLNNCFVSKINSAIFANLSTWYADNNDYNKAIEYMHIALNSAIKVSSISAQASIYNNMGDLYLNLNVFDSADIYIENSLRLLDQLDDKYLMAVAYYSKSELLFKQHKFKESLNNMTTSYHLAQKTGAIELVVDAVTFMAKIEFERNNFELAYQYMLIEKEISDSILIKNKESQSKYTELQLSFKEKEDYYKSNIANTGLLYKLEKVNRQRERYTLVFILIIIILISVFAFLYALHSKRISKNMIQKRREVEEKKSLLEISNIELKEQHAFIETLLNTIPNPVFYTDRKNGLIGCNHAFEDITGLKEEDIIGLKLDEIEQVSGMQCPSNGIFSNKKLSLQRSEGEMIYNDSSKHHVVCYRKTIMHNGASNIGSIGILNDVTDIKKAELKILDSETKLKIALNAKDKFFNIMAHDLKNPFNGIMGLSGIMNENIGNFTQKEIKTNIKQISQASVRVYNLLENLLEWARAQSGSMVVNYSAFIMHEPIQECLDLFSQNINSKNIEINLSFSKDVYVKADQNMALSIFRNLISNAVKFSNENGTININIETNNKFAIVSIEDNGIGITKKNLEKLFKIDAPLSTIGTDNEKGTGLGLIIVQEFIKQNKGKIKVESIINEGTKFEISLPLAKEMH